MNYDIFIIITALKAKDTRFLYIHFESKRLKNLKVVNRALNEKRNCFDFIINCIYKFKVF